MKKIFLFCVIFSFIIYIPIICLAGTCGKDDVCLKNPLTDSMTATSPNALIGQIINGALGIVGSLALLMFIYGGFTWMMAAGDSGKVQKGKDILIWATIGLVVIFSAYAVVKFVLTGILGTG